jgi:adenosylcobinamide-phosphate synthase
VPELPFDAGTFDPGLLAAALAPACAILLAALLADALVGDIPLLHRWAPTPRKLARRLAAAARRRLDRPGRGRGALAVRGLLTALVLVGGFAAAGAVLQVLFAQQPQQGRLLEFLLVLTAVSLRRPWNRATLVGGAMAAGRRPLAQAVLGDLSDRHPPSLDDHGILRAAAEGLARALDRGVVAPSAWYLAFGLPGLGAWIAAEALDAAAGRGLPAMTGFGVAPARLFAAMDWAPARLTAALLVLASLPTPTANPWRALATSVRDGGRHASPNLGRPMGALAGALGLSLHGPDRRGEVVADRPWIGDGRARMVPADLRRAQVLCGVAVLILVALVVAALLWALLTL